MNNNWGAEHYPMHNMMNMPPMMQQNMMPPLMPPMCMISEMSSMNSAPAGNSTVIDDNDTVEDMNIANDQDELPNPVHKSSSRDKSDNRGDSKRERDKDRSRRSRERYDRNDRGDRNVRDRSDRGRRDRRSKWDNGDSSGISGLSGGESQEQVGAMIMPGGIMQFAHMGNMLGQQQMNMSHMSNISSMANMNNMQNIQQNMMPGMIMDPMMMMNQQMMPMHSQPIHTSGGQLLPPIPGTNVPNRREKPLGCRTIFVGGLPNGITEKVVNEIFKQFGDISDIKLHRQGACHVRFEKSESVEQAFFITGYRYKTSDQVDTEATTIYIDYALNREDQVDYNKNKRFRVPTPPRIEPFTPAALSSVSDKVKSDEQFIEAAPTLLSWLERGECNRKNASLFYSLVQASNNQIRRLFNEKMVLDDEYHTLKSTLKDKFANIVVQFEQVAKILTAAKHQRVSDHFTKQQRKNIDMWLKMTEEVENIKEEFNINFDEEEIERIGKNVVAAEKYEALKAENESLIQELEGYKNEAYLAKDEAERKFEKFKAHFVAQQALENKQVYPPLPPPPKPTVPLFPPIPPNIPKPQPPPPTPDDGKVLTSGPLVPPSEAKLISILTAFLMVHPLGASLAYLVSYVRSMVPNVTQATVHDILNKYTDVFCCKTTGIGASIEHRWGFVTFDVIKQEA